MKVVILAGGLGTRISEYTKTIPKPMIKIFGKPILHRIIDHYISYGHKEFYIALGYKGNVIKEYFRKKKFNKEISINLIETGKNTMTGGRLKRLKKYLDDTFLLTYGDGLSDINLHKLVKFHKKHKKVVTLTAVHPPARFGELKLSGNVVKSFQEKPQLQDGWINGGFFVLNKKFIKYIPKKNVQIEREPLTKAAEKKQFMAYKHTSFWYCIDNRRDLKVIERMCRKGKEPWNKLS